MKGLTRSVGEKKADMFLKPKTKFSLLIAGILLTSIGILLNLEYPLKEFIHKQFILSESSLIYPYWAKNPMKVKDNFYLFNWTNPGDLKDPGYKPQFEEVGPYAFEETLEKVNIVWNENGTVTYKRNRLWFFNQEESNGSLSDLVTTLNPIPPTAAYLFRYKSRFTKRPLSLALLLTATMDVTKTVGELTFDGYSDALLDAGSWLAPIRNMLPQEKSGYFYQMNGSSNRFDGTFNVETGLNGFHTLGSLRTYDYQNTTTFCSSPTGRVRGVAGEFWPPNRKKTDEILFFATEYCRHLVFKYTKTIFIHGVEGYQYEAVPELFDNGTSNPENQCFCAGDCVPSGVLNVSSCRLGTPSFASFPHYYLADPSYREAVEGMKPDPEKHKVYIVLEPNYGILMEFAARIQMSMMVQPDPDISMYRDIPRMFFPVFWLEQQASLPLNLAIIVKILIVLPSVAYVASIIMLVLGPILLLLFSASWVYPKYENNLSNFFKRRSHEANFTASVKTDVKNPSIKLKTKPGTVLMRLKEIHTETADPKSKKQINQEINCNIE